MYGWVPLAIGLLAWDYFVWKDARPKVKGWFTRKLLTFLSRRSGAHAAVVDTCGSASGHSSRSLGGIPAFLNAGVGRGAGRYILLCIDPESRTIAGARKALSIVSTGVLLLVLTMTVWAGH